MVRSVSSPQALPLIEIFSEETGSFKVNGQRLKIYNTGETVEVEATLALDDPP
jgi:hypothetical protein